MRRAALHRVLAVLLVVMAAILLWSCEHGTVVLGQPPSRRHSRGAVTRFGSTSCAAHTRSVVAMTLGSVTGSTVGSAVGGVLLGAVPQQASRARAARAGQWRAHRHRDHLPRATDRDASVA
jgi:hypothetical protein